MQSIYSEHFGTTRGIGSSVWLGREYQGRGFGTEAGHAALKLGLDGLGGQEAYAGAWADNAVSIRVMEKLGSYPMAGIGSRAAAAFVSMSRCGCRRRPGGGRPTARSPSRASSAA